MNFTQFGLFGLFCVALIILCWLAPSLETDPIIECQPTSNLYLKPSFAPADHDAGDDIIDRKVMMTMLRIMTTMTMRRMTMMTMRRMTMMTTLRMTMMTSGSKIRADDF